MIDISRDLHTDFHISMVPPESYFDCNQPEFDTSLLHGDSWKPEFKYHAKNAYTVLYAKCPDCFDLVMVQLYEGYSRISAELMYHVQTNSWAYATPEAQVKAVRDVAECLMNGWTVDFGKTFGLGKKKVSVPASKLLLGYGNDWVKSPGLEEFKFLYIDPNAAGEGWRSAAQQFRGSFYWAIGGSTGPGGQPDPTFQKKLAQSMGLGREVSQNYV